MPSGSSRKPAYGQMLYLALIILLTSCSPKEIEPGRIEMDFNSDWQFSLAADDFTVDSIIAGHTGLAQWDNIDLPHDWSIEGSFSVDHPAGVGGGALPGGIGWYRKQFTMPQTDSMKKIFIWFDGIYWNSDVYVNGHHVGFRPNGYISFYYDISQHLVYGDTLNTIAVRVNNAVQPNSRWYSGSGIYRNVKFIKTDPVHLDLMETFVSTPVADSNSARVVVKTRLWNSTEDPVSTGITFSIFDEEGRKVGSHAQASRIESKNFAKISAELQVEDPILWSVKSPSLYTLQISVKEHDRIIDAEKIQFGIRWFNFDPEEGFSLNGQQMKILGVCNHHDLGCLGAAVNTRAIERQLEILKEMGCNAIRTAHNPPAPELLDLCDRMGFLVMNETFDMWRLKKSPHDYSKFWDEWYAIDLSDHIRRDRNHPSVFAWSIGNEILEQWDPSGTNMTKELAGIVRSLDTTRYILTGNNSPYPSNALIQSGELDLIGYNYKHREFVDFPETFPGACFIATETTSGLMTRGIYDMPSDSIRRWPYRWDVPFTDGNPDHTVSAYDNVSTPWGSIHEETWKIVKKHDFLSGMFVWTGFDYLGEPTPYGWPSRSSYFGIIDLAGFPKDVYYMYKAEWTDEPVLHLFPHWNWEAGEEVDAMVYTNCDSVELFLNGRSLGIRHNSDTTFHLMWRVQWEPGELVAKGKGPEGNLLEAKVATAGPAARLEVLPDRSTIHADGKDLSFVTVNVLDSEGNLVPNAEILITCSVEGSAAIAGTDNGNPVSHEPFTSNYRRAFNGKCLFVLKASEKRGEVRLTFEADGLPSETTILNLE